MMPQHFAQAVDARGLHFEIRNAVRPIGKMGEPVDQVRITETEAQYPALRTIKSRTGNRNAMVKILHEMFHQRGAAAVDIGLRNAMAQLGLGHKGLQQLFILLILFEPVKVQQVIDAQAMGGGHKGVIRDIRLQGTRGTYSNDVQDRQFRLDGAAGKVDIHQSIQFVQHDIYIIRANARRNDRQPFFAQVTRMGNEFPVLALKFDLVEMFAHCHDPVGITHCKDCRGQFFRPHIQVVNGTPFIDNKFRFLNALHKKCVGRECSKYPTNILLLHTPYETGIFEETVCILTQDLVFGWEKWFLVRRVADRQR